MNGKKLFWLKGFILLKVFSFDFESYKNYKVFPYNLPLIIDSAWIDRSALLFTDFRPAKKKL